jgi:uncharacterized RDD family membrane protein YckC
MATDNSLRATAETAAKVEYAGFWIRLAAMLMDLMLLVFALWVSLAIVAYFIGFWTWRGQTLGQIATHTKVVRADGQPMDLGVATLRFIGYLVCALTLGIGFLLIVFDEQNRGLHDRIAGTHVISLEKGQISSEPY